MAEDALHPGNSSESAVPLSAAPGAQVVGGSAWAWPEASWDAGVGDAMWQHPNQAWGDGGSWFAGGVPLCWAEGEPTEGWWESSCSWSGGQGGTVGRAGVAGKGVDRQHRNTRLQAMPEKATPAPTLGATDEHVARVHYQKTYQVLCEVFEKHAAALRDADSFLDLGCAPGGFSARILDERSTCKGFGVTLPVNEGGFPLLIDLDRLHVQAADLMDLRGPSDLDCPGGVDVVMADAQDLGRRSHQERQLRGGKGAAGRSAGRGDAGGGGGRGGAAKVGVQAAHAALGIWAITLQEVMLACGSLRDGGTFFFRFGWRGRGATEEYWYREATTRLLALVLANFASVVPFKSEFSHQADACFYVVCTGFKQEVYAAADLEEKLRDTIASILACREVRRLPSLLEAMKEFATPEARESINGLLDLVSRMRAVGVATRQHLEGTCAGGSKGKGRDAVNSRPNPQAGLWISPLPFNLTIQRLQERLERFGKIANIRRKAHPIGVGADAVVHFAQPAHAAAALHAIMELKVLGGSIRAQLLCDAQAQAQAAARTAA